MRLRETNMVTWNRGESYRNQSEAHARRVFRVFLGSSKPSFRPDSLFPCAEQLSRTSRSASASSARVESTEPLVVAALKTVEYLLRETKENACLACVLSCVRSLIEYFNRFAYVYVALYGFDFRRAGSAVFGLFRSSGWTVVIHDDLLGIVLLFGALACGVVGAVIGVGVGSAFEDDSLSTAVIYAFVGLLTGLFAAQQVFCVLDSAFATVLVAWAEEPAALRASNPSLYLRLYEAWNTHQHDLFETAKSRYPEKYTIPNGV